MTQTFFIAPGFEINGQRLVLYTPSPSTASLTINLARGNGLRIADALDQTGGAEADGSTLVFSINGATGDLSVVVRSDDGWSVHVILLRKLADILRAELGNL